MARVVPALLGIGLAACGSSPPPPPAPPPPPPAKPTRVVVEDESAPTEGTEEKVTFVKTKGSIEKEQIEEGLASHQQAMAECYTSKVGKRRWLGGHVVLHWDLEADGKITSVKLLESTLGNWAVEQCLVDEAWTATFGKPAGGKVDFTVPLDFSAKGGTAIWDDDKALRAVGGQIAILDDCDDFELTPKPGKHARKAPKKKPPKPEPAKEEKPARPEKVPSNVTMTLYVGPGGKLQSIGFASPTAEVGQKWSACVEKAAQSWRLPDPRGQIAKLAIKFREARVD